MTTNSSSMPRDTDIWIDAGRLIVLRRRGLVGLHRCLRIREAMSAQSITPKKRSKTEKIGINISKIV